MKRIVSLCLLALMLAGCATNHAPAETTAASTTITESTVLESVETRDKTAHLVSNMSLEEKVGQLFLAKYTDETALMDAQSLHLGGFILYADAIQGRTAEELRMTLEKLQSVSSLPLLIAVDEEGGTVTRISRYAAYRDAPFLSPRKLYAKGGMDAVLEAEKEKSVLLRRLGINVNMAPVCDITTDPSAFMYDRSLGLSPRETGTVIAAMVKAMSAYDIGSVLKHFPGYGNNTDTHTAMAVDNRPLRDLENADLIPFAAGIQAGCGAVLVSHTIIQAMDPGLPASLSPEVHRYLREEMSFDGVIITDDLDMEAITGTYDPAEAAVLAVLAGNDLLCCKEYLIQYAAVLQAVQDGTIPMDILDAAVSRVLRWKAALGLL